MTEYLPEHMAKSLIRPVSGQRTSQKAGRSRPRLSEHLDIIWRTLATGLCFALFGLGAVLLGTLVFPLLRVSVRKAGRERAAKAIMRRSFSVFVMLMRALGVLSLEVRGAERLQRSGMLVVANHPSLIDVVLLMSLMPRADCVVKAALARNPVTRASVRAAGYQFNDSTDGLILDCIASVRSGNNLVIFPEGTRTPASGVVRLRRGAAAISVRGDIPLTPIRIQCAPPALRKGDKWYRVPRRRPHFVIDVGEDLAIDALPSEHTRAIRRLNSFLTEFLSRSITQPHESA